MKGNNFREKEADVLLIYPKTGMDFASTVAPPHSLLAIAAPIHKKGYKVKIIDQRVNFNWRQEATEILKSKPICVGISCMTGTQIHFAIEAAKLVRSVTDGSIPVVWGGPHPSTVPQQTLESEHVDIMCVGEADYTFLELVEALQSKRPLSEVAGIGYKEAGKPKFTSPRPLMDVEQLLPVQWELIDVDAYIHPDMYLKESNRTLDIGQTSRGCPFLCGFCSSAAIRQRKWRAMTVERSLEAIVEPVKRFKLNGIWIRDDEFYINKERAAKICAGMIDAGLKICWYTSGTRVDVFNKSTDEQIGLLKKSGAYVLKFGAESGSNRILKLMNKGITREDTIKCNLRCKAHGIIPVFALMMGFPTETFEEINETLDLATQLKRDYPQAQFETMSPYTALPGTPMFDLSVQMGLKQPDSLEGWSRWSFEEYDWEGRKLPWYSYSDRMRIGNLVYISILANGFPNALDGIKNEYLRVTLRNLFKPLIGFFRYRFRSKRYNFAPELVLARLIRTYIIQNPYFAVR